MNIPQWMDISLHQITYVFLWNKARMTDINALSWIRIRKVLLKPRSPCETNNGRSKCEMIRQAQRSLQELNACQKTNSEKASNRFIHCRFSLRELGKCSNICLGRVSSVWQDWIKRNSTTCSDCVIKKQNFMVPENHDWLGIEYTLKPIAERSITFILVLHVCEHEVPLRCSTKI
jgi:hypothetical protein